MKSPLPVSLFAILNACLTAASPLQPRTHGPPAFLLAGDSTTAAQSCCGGGWGNGFLSTLRHGAIGANFGHNGATTVSFVSGGDWADVLESVNRYKKNYTPYVTIQFGHNDQKASANISIEQYSTNLKSLAIEVQKAGGYPILVTPLSRRNYNSSTPYGPSIIEDLAPQRIVTLSVASSIGAFAIDLNLASTDYLNKIGKANAVKYNLVPSDNTHLNAAGSVVFGSLVSGLMGNVISSEHGYSIDQYTQPDGVIWADINEGIFVLPN